MAYPFKKILCPLDFDENSIAALDVAAEMARESDATLEVLHVVPLIIQAGGTPIYVDVYTAQEQESQAKLVALAKTHLGGLKCELRTTIAEPSAAILHAEKTVGADIIVMSTHGRRGLAHFFLGSVAERVVREAQCPVLTIRGDYAAQQPASTHA
jgi:nucleotide-binding universal stress UspA family protein